MSLRFKSQKERDLCGERSACQSIEARIGAREGYVIMECMLTSRCTAEHMKILLKETGIPCLPLILLLHYELAILLITQPHTKKVS